MDAKTLGEKPAFPLGYDSGITLREYYAGQALAGLSAITELGRQDTAEMAVEIADLTLNELVKEKP